VQDNVICQTNYLSHHSFNTMIKNEVRERRLMTVTLNLEKL